MDYKPNVRFINAHPEGIGGYDHPRFIFDPLVLSFCTEIKR
jgi:hypothetical protein